MLIPLVSALLVGRPAGGAYLLATAGVAAFLAHEGLLVRLGQRGGRAAREQHADALRSVALFGGFALVAGGVALTVLPRAALGWLLLPVALAAGVGAAVVARVERSTPGELLVAAALSSLCVPVALAGDVPLPAALTLFLVFAAVFITATVSIRALIGRVTKGGGPPPAAAVALSLVVLAAFALSSARGVLPAVAPWAALPVCAVSLWLTAKPPSPKYLRQIGWTLVGATVLTAAMLVVGLARPHS